MALLKPCAIHEPIACFSSSRWTDMGIPVALPRLLFCIHSVRPLNSLCRPDWFSLIITHHPTCVTILWARMSTCWSVPAVNGLWRMMGYPNPNLTLAQDLT